MAQEVLESRAYFENSHDLCQEVLEMSSRGDLGRVLYPYWVVLNLALWEMDN